MCVKMGFTLEGKVFVSPQVKCVSTNANKDCKGTMYCDLHDKPYGVSKAPFHQASSPNISHGAWYALKGIPFSSTVYVECFLDDDNNADPKAPKSSSGDLHHHGYLAAMAATDCHGYRYCVVFDHRDP